MKANSAGGITRSGQRVRARPAYRPTLRVLEESEYSDGRRAPNRQDTGPDCSATALLVALPSKILGDR